MKKTYYELLGVAPSATQEEIRSAYRKLAHRYHPDTSEDVASADRFIEITNAYEVLGDVARRKTYDLTLQLEAKKATTASQIKAAPKVEPKPKPPKPNAPTDDLVKLTGLFGRGKFDEAERFAVEILERDPRQAVAYGVLGDIARARGNRIQAIDMYGRAVQMDPRNPLYLQRYEELVRASTARGAQQSGIATSSVATIGVGVFLVLLGVIYVAIGHEAALAPSISLVSTWTLGLVVMLFLAGVIVGASLSVANLVDSFSSVNMTALGKISPTVALGSIAIVSFWAATCLYVILGVGQNAFNYSTSRLITGVAGVVALMSIAASISPVINPLQVILWGGNLVYIGAISGWMVVDSLHRA